jgi:hypothetical protein
MAKTKKLKPSPDVKDICFTIMPFGGYFDSYYESIYMEAIKNCGLEPRRADDLFRPSSIVSDIWELTKNCKIILADLSGKNPNVFYELGLAHAITKPAILITQSMDDVPFDLRGLRIIVYEKNEHNWGDILRRKIQKAINETLVDADKSIPPTFLNTKGVKKVEVTPEGKELLEIKNDIELLKNQVAKKSYLQTVPSLKTAPVLGDLKELIKMGQSERVIIAYARKKFPELNDESIELLIEAITKKLPEDDG